MGSISALECISASLSPTGFEFSVTIRVFIVRPLEDEYDDSEMSSPSELSITILVLSCERKTLIPTRPACWFSDSYRAVKSEAVVEVVIVIGFWFRDSISNETSPFPLKLYNSILFLAVALTPRSDMLSLI